MKIYKLWRVKKNYDKSVIQIKLDKLLPTLRTKSPDLSLGYELEMSNMNKAVNMGMSYPHREIKISICDIVQLDKTRRPNLVDKISTKTRLQWNGESKTYNKKQRKRKTSDSNLIYSFFQVKDWNEIR